MMLNRLRAPILVPLLAPLLALALAPALAPTAAPAAAQVAAETPVPAELEAATALVRTLYFGQDFHEGAAVGLAALDRWPDSPELVAWTVTNLARSDRAEAALERAKAVTAARPDDVWGHIARAFALTYQADRSDDALEASLRPLALAPTMPEAVWVRAFVLQNQRKLDEVAPLIEEKWPVLDRPWAELRTVQGNATAAMRFDDPEKLEEGLATMADARELDPDNVNAHFFAASLLLGDRRVDDAVPLLERAVGLSPGSPNIASAYWRAIRARRDLDAEEKAALVASSAAALLELRGHHPAALRSVASTFSAMDMDAEARQLQERVLTEFGETVDAEWVLADRWRDRSRKLHEGEVEDSAAARAELRSMWWAFVDRPNHHHKGLLGEAYRNLFSAIRHDDTVPPDTLLLVARGVAEHERLNPSFQPRLAIALAERQVYLDEARAMALGAVEMAEDYISERLTMFDTPGAAADALDWLMAEAYAALAFVETRAGDFDVAREAIDLALEFKPDNPNAHLYAGALAEAEGDLEAAEIHYGRGFQYERTRIGGDRPNREALERIYHQRHGSMDGYDAHLEQLVERDRERRWQKVSDSRLEEPRSTPVIDLEWLDGGRIDADEIDGRIVVINFWGVWCGPCVAEAPQLQKFHEKYRDDTGVLFLTINNDDDPDKVRSWMTEKEYDYLVLLDDGFVSRAGVRAFPTTWFIAPDGQIVFEHIGASEVVYEEFVWRVEMLKAERDGRVITVSEASR